MKIKELPLLHGADYNYEQWLEYPQILDDDIRLMKKAGCNVMSVGIFSWAMLEPEEGKYDFSWMDQLFERLFSHGIYINLATPSGAKPAWMSEKYPEIRMVSKEGHREPHYFRHNHCRTSPVYRQKCNQINTRLAERYKDHPGLVLWHVSNEYNGGPCHCDLCYAAFRNWLKNKYGNLENLNQAWWTRFWSHRYSTWEQIAPVDESVHGLMLDWMRFISDQSIDFFLAESRPLRTITPHVPITTNFMIPDVGLDYWSFASHIDIVSWDNYPRWHIEKEEWRQGVKTSFYHDLHRSYKHKPFLLMESTPDVTNWQGVSRPKRPNMHLLSSLQAVAHGSDSVLYFQWRQSRGGAEKFHSAVVSHAGHENTRVFQNVCTVGKSLEKLALLKGSLHKAEVAIIYDYPNEWILKKARLPETEHVDYQERCIAHYLPFWKAGIPVDIIDSVRTEFSGYKLLIAPMLYMLRAGVAERIKKFVNAGGVFIATYLTGIVDENDLCFLGGFPGPLRDVMGLWVEDTEVLNGDAEQSLVFCKEGITRPGCQYTVQTYADIVHPESAEKLAEYNCDFIKGNAAVTGNSYGQGFSFYLASRNNEAFYADFYQYICKRFSITGVFKNELPEGITVQKREFDDQAFLFLMNFTGQPREIACKNETYKDLLQEKEYTGKIELEGYGIKVLVKK